jgi:hypothetical protein
VAVEEMRLDKVRKVEKRKKEEEEELAVKIEA